MTSLKTPEQILEDKLMKILGSSINFKGLADDWYIKHKEEDIPKIKEALAEYHIGLLPKEKDTSVENMGVPSQTWLLNTGFNQAINQSKDNIAKGK